MNTTIKSILTKEFDKYEQYFAKNDMLKCVKKYCREASFDLKELRATDEFDLCDDEACVLKVLDNTDLQQEIQKAISNIATLNTVQNRQHLYENLKKAFQLAIEKQKETQIDTQIIFLEYDYAPYFCLCGFGEGDYPLLKKPEYIKFDYTKEVFNGIGKVDFSPIWQPIQTEWADEIFSIDLNYFSNIKKMYVCLAYLMLHEVFQEFVKDAVFLELKKTTPLFIYANEHDCAPSNIYIFEG